MRRKHPEEVPKAFKVGFVPIHISSNSLAKTLLRWMETVCSTFQDLQFDGSL